MALSIRNPNVEKMARQLAARRGMNMTDAIQGALEQALQKENDKEPLEVRFMRKVKDFNRENPDVRPPMTKEEIDALWGQ